MRRIEGDGDNHLALLQRRLEQAGKEVRRLDLAGIGNDDSVERQKGGRIIRCRIVVGNRPADRAHMANMRIADMVGEIADCRTDSFQLRGRGNVEMRRRCPDPHGRAIDGNTLQIGNMPQIDEIARRSQPLLHRGDQRHAAGQILAFVSA